MLGNSGVGKSTLIRHFLHGPVGLKQHPPRPTPSPAHYVKRPPMPSKGDVDTVNVSEEVLAARPSTLVITEFPEADMAAAMELAAHQCDVMAFVVDPGSAASMEWFLSTVESVPDNVPCFVVSCPHGPSNAERSRALRDACDALTLDVFDFVPRVSAAHSAEIFQFAAALSPLPELDNPLTVARVRRRETNQFWARVRTATVAAGALVVAAGVLLTCTSSGKRVVRRLRGKT